MFDSYTRDLGGEATDRHGGEPSQPGFLFRTVRVNVYIGIGSNLGDRQANILAALQRLRAYASIGRVSSFYESEPADGAGGPAFLNVAAELNTNLDRAEFERTVTTRGLG